MKRTNQIVSYACLALLSLALGACSTTGEKEPQVKKPKQLEISASANLNPDAKGRASPLVVHLCELKSAAGFNGADFFSLVEKPQEALGSELVGCKEFFIRPGEKQTLTQPIKQETLQVGVIAAFRDFSHAQWRDVVDVSAGGERLQVVVGASDIKIKLQ